jgi:hypothetical protein
MKAIGINGQLGEEWPGAATCGLAGEVLVGRLDLDPTSIRYAPEGWRPGATLVQLLTADLKAR